MTAYKELLEKAYELYKADWCASRGYDLALVQETELKDEEYNGEMYASLGEFEDCEFADEEYMRALIGEGYDKVTFAAVTAANASISGDVISI